MSLLISLRGSMQWNSGAIHEAIATAKRQKKIFLVYIEGPDDGSKKMTEIFNTPAVIQELSDDCIPVKLEANSVEYRQFHQIYPILIVPSTFFIGTTGVPLEVAAGALEQNEFVAKIRKAKLLHQQSINGNAENTTPSQTENGTSQHAEASSESVENPESDNSQSANEMPTTSASTVPLDERVERAKQLLAEKKSERMKEEQEDERRKELEYRKMGQEMRRAKATREQKEMEEWAQSRKKEREEERVARERVRQQIAQDRAERAARLAPANAKSTEKQNLASPNQGSGDFQSKCIRIQLRLPDGSSKTQEFPADATLGDVHRFVAQELRPPFSRFSLATTFPRRQFEQQDYLQTLVNLGLAPSAVLLLLPEKSVSLPVPQGGRIVWSILTTVFSPLMALWSYVASFFGQSRPPRDTNNQPASASNEPEVRPSRDSAEQAARRRLVANQPYRREGNIHRFSNNGTDSDDENNTWNGNSTQQL